MLFLTCTLFGAVLSTSPQISKTAAVITLHHYFCHRHLLPTSFLSDFLGCTKKQVKSKPESSEEARLPQRQGHGAAAPAPSRPSAPVVGSRLAAAVLHQWSGQQRLPADVLLLQANTLLALPVTYFPFLKLVTNRWILSNIRIHISLCLLTYDTNADLV